MLYDTKVTIGGKEYELDIYDADTVEKYEAGTKEINDMMGRLKPEMSEAAATREICHAVFKFFNSIFGEGTDKAVFGEKTNLTKCLEEVEAVTGLVGKQRAAMEAKIKKLAGNRQTRRAKK